MLRLILIIVGVVFALIVLVAIAGFLMIRSWMSGAMYRFGSASLHQLNPPAQRAEEPRWLVYHEPIRLEPGTTVTVRVVAHRIGYKPSDEVAATFTIT